MKIKKLLLLVYGTAILIITGSFFIIPPYQNPGLRNIAFKLSTFNKWYPQQKVYLHTDKQRYSSEERIWIKAYMLYASSHKPDNSDENLYVELINPSGFIVQIKIVRLEEGLAYCDFPLQDTIPEGNYKIRAYTNWMKNFSEDFYFSKIIYISNPSFATYATRDAVREIKKSRRKTIQKQSNFDVAFLPEGGHLLTGVENRVAFKAINELGKSIEIEGVLKDRKGTSILDFSSSHKGMGSFVFTPEQGNKYIALISSSGRKKKSFSLPELTDMGINISSEPYGDSIKVQIVTNMGQGRMPANPVYSILVHVRGEPVFTAEMDIRDKDSYVVYIPKKMMPTGIAHITLFNSRPAPVSERLIFVNHNDHLQLNITTDKSVYGMRERVKLKMFVTDSEGLPVESEFSLAIAEQKSSEVSSNIITYLLLSSDLKGNIETPAYYFTEVSEKKEKDLDLLMMTHGWRRFNWNDVLRNEKRALEYNKQKGLEIAGRITRDFFNIPLRDIKVTLTILDQFNDVFERRSGQNGEYKFENLYYSDVISAMIEAEKPTGKKNLLIHLNSFELEQDFGLNYFTEKYLSKPGPMGKNSYKEEEEEEEEDPFEELNNRINRIHSEPRDVIIVDDHLRNFSSLGQILQGRVPGLQVIGNRVVIRGISTFSGNTDPLFLVDGISVDPGMAMSMNPVEIDRIEILKGPDAAIYGLRGANGVVAIYTRRGKFMIRGKLEFKMLGYATPSEFYSPRYGTGEFESFNDDRKTLLWVPDLKTDINGIAEINFFTSDIPGKYLIIAEGLNKDGIPGAGIKNIELK